jgi:predicted DNA-binding protein (UPF0251 family)
MSNNTPAFPSAQLDTTTLTYKYVEGMTLRDYFAAKAMEADMIAGVHENDFAWSAARSYKMADAMLEARNAAQ